MTVLFRPIKRFHRDVAVGMTAIGEAVGEILFAAAPVLLGAFFACLAGAGLFGVAYVIHAGWLAAGR